MSKAYEQKIDVVNVITAPEIEMLIIHAEGAYDQFKRSGKKPSEFCKTNLRMHDVKSYEIESSSMPRWETNEVFFLPQSDCIGHWKNQNKPYVVLQGQPKCAYEANAKPEDSC